MSGRPAVCGNPSLIQRVDPKAAAYHDRGWDNSLLSKDIPAGGVVLYGANAGYWTLGLTMARAKLHLMFGAASLVAFPVATAGFDFIARVAVSHEPVLEALVKCVQWLTSPLSAFLLLLPFVAAALLGAEFGHAVNARAGKVFYGLLMGLLALLYFTGFWDSQVALQERKWTAASLAVGTTVLLSVPLLLVAGTVGAVMAWRHRKRET